MIQCLEDQDPTTRHMLGAMFTVEEKHVDELADLVAGCQTRSQRPTA